MQKKIKSPEITRFLMLLDKLELNASILAERTGVAERTINNYIWGDMPIGGQLLRGLVEFYGVSVDWLLTGHGRMFMNDQTAVKSLLPFFETVDLNTVQDFWWLAARGVEESLLQSGAVPNKDYSVVDLYQLSQSLVTTKFANGELLLQANESI